ncbi:uncharacterized protein [Rhodnius prolixus]|uniref:uncharacterized protein n=1 Tax=Rhodnius prolixus TaxID=13249 RepID=UPI003D188007
MMSSYIRENHRHWDKELSKLEFAIKTGVHDATGYTPAYLNYGRELPRTAFEYERDPPDETSGEIGLNRERHMEKLKAMPILYKEVQDRLDRAYEKGQRAYNLRRRPVEYLEGQVVRCRTHPQSDASSYFSGKLAPKFVKRKVRKKISSVAYELEDPSTGVFAGVWNVKDLKEQPVQEES